MIEDRDILIEWITQAIWSQWKWINITELRELVKKGLDESKKGEIK